MDKIVGFLGKRYVGEAVANQIAAEDPYYIYEEQEDNTGKKSYKKIKRQLPVGISKRDEKILKKVRRKAWCLDLVFSLCGFRVGWTVVIGLIPWLGDIINTYLGMSLINAAEKIEGGLPAGLRSRMVINVAIDFGLQLVPVLGDIAGAVFKSNSRNYMLLENHLRKKANQNPIPPHQGGAGGGYMIGSKYHPAQQQQQQQQQPQQQQQAPPVQHPPPAATGNRHGAEPLHQRHDQQQSGVY